MKKLVIAAAVLALSAGVNANTADESATGFGGLTTATLTAMGVSAAVAAAIRSPAAPRANRCRSAATSCSCAAAITAMIRATSPSFRARRPSRAGSWAMPTE